MSSRKARIAVLVSGQGTNLQAIIDAEKSGLIESGEVVLVVSSNEKAFAAERAKLAGIETHIVTKVGRGNQDAFESKIKELIDDRNIDLIVLAGFLTILSADFVKYYDHKIINVHPALIPAFSGDGYYGMKPYEEAIKRGVKITGATVHYVNEIADGGEIISQKAVEVKDDDTPETLRRRVLQEAEWLILPTAIAKLCRKIVSSSGERQ